MSQKRRYTDEEKKVIMAIFDEVEGKAERTMALANNGIDRTYEQCRRVAHSIKSKIMNGGTITTKSNCAAYTDDEKIIIRSVFDHVVGRAKRMEALTNAGLGNRTYEALSQQYRIIVRGSQLVGDTQKGPQQGPPPTVSHVVPTLKRKSTEWVYNGPIANEPDVKRQATPENKPEDDNASTSGSTNYSVCLDDLDIESIDGDFYQMPQGVPPTMVNTNYPPGVSGEPVRKYRQQPFPPPPPSPRTLEAFERQSVDDIEVPTREEMITPAPTDEDYGVGWDWSC